MGLVTFLEVGLLSLDFVEEANFCGVLVIVDLTFSLGFSVGFFIWILLSLLLMLEMEEG